MKRHFLAWLKITVFFILFIITFVILSAVVRPGGINLDTISGFYGEKEDSLDMVYIGGSAAFVYWEPLKAYEDIGIASYSFASDTMQAELYEYMIKEINKHHNPELIIIDARAFQYRKEDQPPSEVAYRNLLTGTPMNIDKINVINKVVPNYLSEDTFPYYFDIVKYHTSEIHHKQDFVKRLFFDYEYDTKGFYFVPKVDKITKYDNKTDKVMPLDKTTSEILDNLLKYIQHLQPYFQHN